MSQVAKCVPAKECSRNNWLPVFCRSAAAAAAIGHTLTVFTVCVLYTVLHSRAVSVREVVVQAITLDDVMVCIVCAHTPFREGKRENVELACLF